MSTPFTAGTGGYHTYRIPALLNLGAGTLLAFCEGRKVSASDYGDIDIVSCRSTDGGVTWEPPRIAQSHASNTAANPAPVIDPASGDVVLLSCRNSSTATSYKIRTGASSPRTVYMQRSSTQGESWGPAVEVTSARESWMRHYGTGPGHAVAMASGRLVVPCWHTRAPAAGSTDDGSEPQYYGNHLIFSDDGGASWSVGAVASDPSAAIHPNETTLAELPSGGLYLSIRCGEDDAPGNRADAHSADAGVSFTAYPRVQATLPLPVCHGSVLPLPDGRLVHSGPLDPVERMGLGLWVSADDGHTWELRHRVTGRLAAYSDLQVVGPDLAVLYETGDVSLYERIDFVRVPLAALN